MQLLDSTEILDIFIKTGYEVFIVLETCINVIKGTQYQEVGLAYNRTYEVFQGKIVYKIECLIPVSAKAMSVKVGCKENVPGDMPLRESCGKFERFVSIAFKQTLDWQGIQDNNEGKLD